jgi:polysaccharide export outer membrane protein
MAKSSIYLKLWIFTAFILFITASVTCAYEPSSEAFNYKIGPRDIIDVTILTSATSMSEDKTARYKLSVNSFGEIAIPLAGKIRAENLSSADLESAILLKLKRFYKDPQVSVTVMDFRSKVVHVMGQVEKNGLIYLTREKTTLAQIISEAGGFIQPRTALTEGADSRNVIVTRGDKRIVVNLHSQLTDLQKIVHFMVQPGDLIYVPKPLKRFQVLGGVQAAGEFELVENMTLLRALSLAGSFNDKARRERVYILRLQPDGTKERIHIDCRRIVSGTQQDVPIELDDIIFVAEW